MRLESVRVRLFRNIVDSGIVEIHPDVTCVVGKNESGKTALLQALHFLNPADQAIEPPHKTLDYPRWRMTRDRRDTDLDTINFVEATFAPELDDRERLSEELLIDLPQDFTVEASRNYVDELTVKVNAAETDWVRTVLRTCEQVGFDKAILDDANSLEEIETKLRRWTAEREKNATDQEPTANVSNDGGTEIGLSTDVLETVEKIQAVRGTRSNSSIQDSLASALPSFFYFVLESNSDGVPPGSSPCHSVNPKDPGERIK